MPKATRHSAEVRERAVRLVTEAVSASAEPELNVHIAGVPLMNRSAAAAEWLR